jgi:hypothetical protein
MSDSVVETLKNATAAQDVPEDVSAWLGRLVLLYGVPFHYLVPEEAFLPLESIRFFYLDPIWIQCAIQGACSVGNTDYGDTLIDKAMNTLVQPNRPASGEKTTCVSSVAAAGVRDRLRQQYEDIPAPTESQDLAWPLTGFLLRSAVVRGWRGLEIMAYKALTDAAEKQAWAAKALSDEDKAKVAKGFAPLQALRIEQLSAEVMLGLFNGKIDHVVVRQPQESLHFGVTRDGSTVTKKLRKLGFNDPAGAGSIYQQSVVDVAKLVRAQGPPGVINVAALAAEMESQLKPLGELKEGKFTSAEFAVEMIEAPGEFSFTLETPVAGI